MLDDSSSDALEEEFCAVQAIFGEDCETSTVERLCEVFLPSRYAEVHVRLRVDFPEGYPDVALPSISIDGPKLSAARKAILTKELHELFVPGEVCYYWSGPFYEQSVVVIIFKLTELLREREEWWMIQETSVDDPDSQAYKAEEEDVSPRPAQSDTSLRDDDPELMASMSARITTGQPYTERKSTFQAHVARVNSVAEVQAMMAILLQDSKIRRATHNMLAYRFCGGEKATICQDFNDDGESAAGSRLLHMLQIADVQGVCVVVSRWFGGTLLGPSRFTIINNTARQLLEQTGYLEEADGKRKRVKKK